MKHKSIKAYPSLYSEKASDRLDIYDLSDLEDDRDEADQEATRRKIVANQAQMYGGHSNMDQYLNSLSKY